MEQTFSTPPSPPSLPGLAPASQFLGRTLTFYKEHWRAFVSIMMPVFVLNAVVIVYNSFPVLQSHSLGLVIPLFSLAAVVVSLLATIVLVFYLARPDEGTAGLYGRARSHFWSFVLAVFLQQLAVFGGFALFIIPGIFAAISLTLVPYVLILENKRGTKALMGSWLLVKDFRGSVFLKMLFLVLVLFLVSGILLGLSLTPTWLAIGSIDFSQLAADNVERELVTATSGIWIMLATLFSSAVQTLFLTPLSIMYVFLLYKSLRQVKGEQSLESDDAKRAHRWITVYYVFGALAIIAMLFLFGLVFAFLATELLTSGTGSGGALLFNAFSHL